MRALFVVVWVTVAVAGCSKPSEPTPKADTTAQKAPEADKTPEAKAPEANTPEAKAPTDDGSEGDTPSPEAELANKAMNELQMTLGKRLKGAMAEGGPAAAIDVCSKEANAMTADIAKKHGIQLGRTSHRLRNPENAPRPWVKAWLDENAGKKASRVNAYEASLDGAVGLINPIPMGGLCTSCHGDPAGLPEEVKGALATRYPEDKATGFEVGDLRGVFWAEVPMKRPPSTP